MARPIVPPPGYVLAGLAIQRLLARHPKAGIRRKAAAGVIVAGALGLFVTVALSFWRNGTTIEPRRPEEASRLVTDGLNALSRNPIYVGMAATWLRMPCSSAVGAPCCRWPDSSW